MVGASFDVPEDNRAFAEKHGFPFRLLSDPDRVAGRAYETVRHPDEPAPEFAKRRTFVIDPDGRIRRAYRVRDITGHPEELLADLRDMAR